MSTWYEKAVFYHMYPLGMTGAPKRIRYLRILLPAALTSLISGYPI